MKRIAMTAVAGVISVALTGCATGGSSAEIDTRREIKAAARAEYPGNARESDTLKLAAVDNTAGGGTLELLNLTDNSVPPAKVWVNGKYLAGTPVIPARSQVSVKYSDLLEVGAGVMDLSRSQSKIGKVEIQTGDGLFTVSGPTRK